MNFGGNNLTTGPFAPPLPTRKRRVVPPASEKVAAARLAFVEAKRAAVECEDHRHGYLVVAHAALNAWIDAEREGQG